MHHSAPQTRRGFRQAYAEHRFGILLALLLTLLAGPTLVFGFGARTAWFEASLTLALLAAVLSLCPERSQRLFGLFLGVPTLLLCLAGNAFGGEADSWFRWVGHLCAILFLFGAAGMTVAWLFRRSALDFDGILGSVCGYLFLGLAWAVAYGMVETSHPGSFTFAPGLRTAESGADPQVLVYYSFVTLTTVGYGDVTPVSPAARTLAWIQALTGQFYLAVIVAGLVSVLAANGNSRRKQVPGDD